MDINETKTHSFLKIADLPDPVCINKWAWSTVHMSIGETMSCHRLAGDKITPETYKDLHNTPSKIRDRKLMLEGKWPENNGPGPKAAHNGCEVCREIEVAGGLSDRLLENSSFHINDKIPKETKLNKFAVHTSPTTLEIYFNNQCNQACVYCAPKFSSLIAAESHRYRDQVDPNNNYEVYMAKEAKEVSNRRKDYDDLVNAHFDWMKDNAKNLHRYSILGGEPFFQPELEQNINFFMNNKCPNLQIALFSNLKVEQDKFRYLLDKISYLITNKHVHSVTIMCSFDCWGEQQEYLRFGSNCKSWEENFRILIKEYPAIDAYVHSTITALTFDTFPELCEKIKEFNYIRPTAHTISTVDSRPFLHPGIMPNKLYADKIQHAIEVYQQIIKLMQVIHYDNQKYNDNKLYSIPNWHRLIAQLKGYEKTFDNHEYDKKLVNQLKNFLSKNDSRRKSNWKLLWPWLDQHEV